MNLLESFLGNEELGEEKVCQSSSATSATSAGRPAVSGLPECVLLSRNPLAALAQMALSSLPAADKLDPAERRIVADALERVVLQWLRTAIGLEAAWDATCPRGHVVRDGIFVRQLLGWACPECEQVLPASECKLKAGGK